MPRRQQQIAADRIVATQVFADTITGSPATTTFTAAQSPQTLTSADSGKIFFLNGDDVTHALPAVADVSAGWNAKFYITAAWQGTVTSIGDIIFGVVLQGTTPAGILASAENTITGAAATVAGDYFNILFDGTNYLVSGQGTAAVYLAFTAV